MSVDVSLQNVNYKDGVIPTQVTLRIINDKSAAINQSSRENSVLIIAQYLRTQKVQSHKYLRTDHMPSAMNMPLK